MKKILFVAGIAVIGLGAAFAQDKKQVAPSTSAQPAVRSSRAATMLNSATPEKIAETRTSRLDKEVTLSADQKKKVYALFLKEAQDNKGRAANREEVNKELNNILTAAQNQKMESVQAERKQRIQERRANRSELKAAPGKVEAVK